MGHITTRIMAMAITADTMTIITTAIPEVAEAEVQEQQPNMPGEQAITTTSLLPAQVPASHKTLHTTTIIIPAAQVIAGIPAETPTGADQAEADLVPVDLQAVADRLLLVPAATAADLQVGVAAAAEAGHLQEVAQEAVAGVKPYFLY